ncbi:PD-(D/E)XK nuclease family protein [Nodularia sp. UHCC 0506]|uniref:PD-(D/E)XK nuclease family protein n=1 Tax=Nodularia sp. UHCC 0506 TaxID=3110243 RepID=UPI002B20D27B|nr:PD-(D/E)XK nuclease family protein [Nodularia sp. UHCC 0506]MEA5512541.1 PD-(D/E)XK nuclease family protein [Nodularia sp. UHCC 0506]
MSLFTNLLNLHSANKPLEDFFTEIIAYFLDINHDILIAWLKHESIINNENEININLLTQESYQPLKHHHSGSKPDIVIKLEHDNQTDIIFIESKIGSTEGWEQLKRYAEILSSLSYPQQRTLIYITRDYEPKEEIEKLLPQLTPNVKFFQLRWYQFYSFLKKYETDTLAKEILTFMEIHRMSHTNQLSSVDLLTMVNFNKTLNFMKSTLSEEVEKEFNMAFGNVTKGAASMTQWTSVKRYIIYNRFDSWNCWCGLGYFNLNPENLTEYPYLGICLEVSPGFKERLKFVEVMQEVVNKYPNKWTSYNLTIAPGWSSISYRKSLQEFLSQEDQLSVIKSFFIESIHELQNIQHYFDFHWKVVSTDEASKEEE